MDYLPGQYGMHYERIGLNDYHFDSLGLAGHRPYYAFSANQLATGEQGSNGNYYWMQQQHSGQHLVGQKQYELTNHLGNVQVTVSDLPYKLGNDTLTRISPALKAVYDYYPFGSPMPGRTIMDTARKCVDMTRLDRVWKAWEMTQTEIYALSLINYHLDGEGEVFIDDNGAVEVETADEHAVFYMELQDSLNNGGEMVLHLNWLEELGEKGFQLYVQGLDAVGEMRVFYQKHYEKPEDAVYLSIADRFTNISVGIQGNLHFRIDNIRYTGGSWVSEEVLVRVCDDGGDRYRFGFNGMLKDNEWAGMGTHLDFGARIYDSRSGRWLSVDPLAEKYPGISTYAFVANNPLMFIDPDGREIWIYYYYSNADYEGFIKMYKYEDGKLYNKKGNLVKQNNPYINDVKKVLDNIKSTSKLVGAMIGELEMDKDNIHVITNYDPIYGKVYKNRNYNRSADEGEADITKYKYNTLTQFNSSWIDEHSTAEATLAHEKKHAYDRWKKQLDISPVKMKNGKTFPAAEWDALNIQNQILNNLGLELILEYGGIEIPEEKFIKPIPKEKDTP